MRLHLSGALAVLLASAGAAPGLAISIDFLPSAQTVPPGQIVTVDVLISGLGAGAPPSVGAFDLDVSFDPTLLSPTGVDFGPFLGDPDLGESLSTFMFVPGAIDFTATSLLLPSELDFLQPSAFRLATLSFVTLGLGTSTLLFSEVIVSDAFGEMLPIASLGSGTIETRKIPEPPTPVPLGAALVALLAAHRLGRARWVRIP